MVEHEVESRLTTLDNGLRVASSHMQGANSVVVGVWIGAGSRDETLKKNGIAHFLEHMVFKGTACRTARDLAEEIEAVGGYLNACTGRETTSYYCCVLPAHVELAIELIADMILRAQLDESEIEREKQVVLQEIGQLEDTPDDRVFDLLQAIAYPDQALGRPIMGSPDSVLGLGRDELLDYVGRHYVAPNMMICAAGQIDHENLVELASRHLGFCREAAAPQRKEARYVGGEILATDSCEQVNLLLGFRGANALDGRVADQRVLATLLGGGMSSRLFQAIREEEGLAYSVFSFASSYVDGGIFGVFAGTSPELAPQLLKRLSEELRRLGEGITVEETARAKAQLRAGRLMARDSAACRAESLAHDLFVFDRLRSEQEILANIEAVQPERLVELWSEVAHTPTSFAVLGPVGHVKGTLAGAFSDLFA